MSVNCKKANAERNMMEFYGQTTNHYDRICSNVKPELQYIASLILEEVKTNIKVLFFINCFIIHLQ
jgi:uncharacterized membrane protein YjdF